jgi:hypothetical protein
MIRKYSAALSSAVLLLAAAAPAAAQKDYYNTDRNRPVRIEDAYATERYALEMKIAPLRLERENGGIYTWGLDPEIGYGILPRTSVEIGFPFAVIDGGGVGSAGLAGIELSAFHNLNVETLGLPAFGIRADVMLPVGSLAGAGMYPSVTGIATRTFTWARFHVNGEYGLGDGPEAGEREHHAASRWLAGLAIDRTFPLMAMLIIGDVHARQPLDAGAEVEWNAGAGARYQVNPYLALDAGVGRRFTGDAGWYFTFGSAYHVGVRSLMPRTW